VYGSAGYRLAGDATVLPSYAQVAPQDHSDWVWATTTSDVRGLQRAASSSAFAATWYAASSFSIDVTIVDGQTHGVAIYIVDWDARGRGQRIDVLDRVTNAVLDSRTVTDFRDGQYLVWEISGAVRIRVTATSGPNAAVSGVFIAAP
jgi:hypothetical protein